MGQGQPGSQPAAMRIVVDKDSTVDDNNGRQTSTPWYMPMFWRNSRDTTAPPTTTTLSSSEQYDCQEETVSLEGNDNTNERTDGRIHEPLKPYQPEEETQRTKRRREGAAASPTTTTLSSSEQYDCREEAMSMEREDDTDGRIHEPLKRCQQKEETQRTKRRRVATNQAFYHCVPARPERHLVVAEYIGPLLQPFLSRISTLGQPLSHGDVRRSLCQWTITAYAPDTKSWRLWITPLPHTLMDFYNLNHFMTTAMLLFPDLFGDTGYWCGVGFAVELHLWLAASYVFLWYMLAAFVFVIARLYSMSQLFWMALVGFNLAPLYLVWTHKKRMDATTKSLTTDRDKAKKDEIHDAQRKEDAKKDQ